ncbi:MAG: 4'-phosphopantetheinyl transferase superfamily protein [Ruminococcus sp.]|nr:4'-phosphopantetheinyl transferase superfamily protein [Ruminococcus sp.]
MKIEYIVLDENLKMRDLAGYEKLLPNDRQEKIARYRFEKDQLRSLIAGLLIRRAIGDSEIIFGAHEKPYAKDSGICFSVSHSGDIVAIAVDENEVGLDVEEIPEENRLKIADRFYHPAERAYVHGAQDKARAFCRIWTRKEAVLKMTGEGISTDLTAFDTTAEPLSGQIVTVDLDNYCLSVCSEKAISSMDVYISKIELKELLQ